MKQTTKPELAEFMRRRVEHPQMRQILEAKVAAPWAQAMRDQRGP